MTMTMGLLVVRLMYLKNPPQDGHKRLKLLPSDGAAYHDFGNSVAISDNQIVVGTQGDDDNGSSSGSAYVFEKPSSGWANMTQTAKLLPSDGARNDYFGNSVAISGGQNCRGGF